MEGLNVMELPMAGHCVDAWRYYHHLHCEDGPAIIDPTGDGDDYFIDGCRITQEVETWIVVNKLPPWPIWDDKIKASFRRWFS